MNTGPLGVTVIGAPGSGKSHFLFYLLNLLQTQGFTVEFQADADFKSKEDLERLAKSMEPILTEIRTTKTIILSEKYANKPLLDPVVSFQDLLSDNDKNMYLARKEHRNAQIRLRKLNDAENPRHGGHNEVGFDKVFTVDSSYFRVPAVGERFNIGDLSTSGVQEIIDDKTFKTYNSIYEWTVLEKTPE